MKTPAKPKPLEMSAEVKAMIDVRHSAEQRGHFEPLGRLLHLETAHGMIEFPTEQGEGTGPDLALCSPLQLSEKDARDVDFRMSEREKTEELEKYGLLILGAWRGLPPLRRNLQKNGVNVPCPRCQHTCDICGGTGNKQCEGVDCGGRGWISGKWIDCPGPRCKADTGKYKADCVTCANSQVRGLMVKEVVCPMCKGSKVMTCSACRGTKKRSTGHVNGSLNWESPACKACGGTGWKGELVTQDLKKFTNALLLKIDRYATPVSKQISSGEFLALGPIHSFTLKDFTTLRLRMFDVSPDAHGDYLMLLVPKTPRGNSRAYLVGGVVREREMRNGAVA